MSCQAVPSGTLRRSRVISSDRRRRALLLWTKRRCTSVEPEAQLTQEWPVVPVPPQDPTPSKSTPSLSLLCGREFHLGCDSATCRQRLWVRFSEISALKLQEISVYFREEGDASGPLHGAGAANWTPGLISFFPHIISAVRSS